MSAPVVAAGHGQRSLNGGLAGPKKPVAPAAKQDYAPGQVPSAAVPAIEEVALATAGYDHTIKFWQADTGHCYRTIQHADSQVNALEMSYDGGLLAACGYQHIRMYDLSGNSPNAVVNYEGVSKNVMDVGFQKHGRWIFTGGEDGTVKIWDPRARNLQCQKVYNAGSPVNSVKLHPNQTELLIGDQNGNVHAWNLRSDKSERFQPQAEASIQCVAIDPQGKRACAVTNKGTCHLWPIIPQDPATTTDPFHLDREGCRSWDAHGKYALRCKFSPDGSLLATSSADQTAKVWRTTDLEKVNELHKENQRWVWDLAFSADSQYLFTASSDNAARLWYLPEGEGVLRREYLGHQKALTCLAFRDGAPANPF